MYIACCKFINNFTSMVISVFKILSFTQDRNINNYEHATEHKFDFIDMQDHGSIMISNTEEDIVLV